jgi:transcriptional regulator with XRE-family HTH domain
MSGFIDESDVKESQPALGRTIRVLREQEGITPSALAKRAAVDLCHLEQIEAGEGGDYNTIVYLRRALAVTAELFTEMFDAFVREEEEDASWTFDPDHSAPCGTRGDKG